MSKKKYLTDKIKEEAINLFLRSIGLTQESLEWKSLSLRNDLDDYIEETFEQLHCCVLWYKSLQVTEKKEKLPSLLKKNGISPVYTEKFSIVITDSSIRFSPKWNMPHNLVFNDPKSHTPDFSDIADLSLI